jgi:LemA protein
MNGGFLPLVVAALVLLLPLLWVVGTFNGLIRLRNQCRESWAGIDTELKRRYDLIPRLVEVVKGYAQYERDVLERVVVARAAAVASTGSPAAQAQDETQLVGAMRNFFGVIERYPDLKADRSFLALQAELVNTEDRIAAARRFYNANVRDFNTRTQVFPANLLAGAFGFEAAEFFEVDDHTIRAAPAVTFGAAAAVTPTVN